MRSRRSRCWPKSSRSAHRKAMCSATATGQATIAPCCSGDLGEWDEVELVGVVSVGRADPPLVLKADVGVGWDPADDLAGDPAAGDAAPAGTPRGRVEAEQRTIPRAGQADRGTTTKLR